MNAYLTYDRIEAQDWTGITSKSPEKRKSPNWLTTWRKDCRFTCWSRCV